MKGSFQLLWMPVALYLLLSPDESFPTLDYTLGLFLVFLNRTEDILQGALLICTLLSTPAVIFNIAKIFEYEWVVMNE